MYTVDFMVAGGYVIPANEMSKRLVAYHQWRNYN